MQQMDKNKFQQVKSLDNVESGKSPDFNNNTTLLSPWAHCFPSLRRRAQLPPMVLHPLPVVCLGALSNWSLFLIPLRDPSFVGGLLHGFKKAKKSMSDRILEIPLGSIVDVKVVSGREHLKTFRTEQANSVSRPFRIVTTKDPCDGETAGPAAKTSIERGAFGVDEPNHILLVGFEDVCRLQRFLVLACESWAIRAGETLSGPMKELLSCAPMAAHRYLIGVFEAMTGCLRNQVPGENRAV